MPRAHTFGRNAEELTASYLVARGWRILDRNWRFRRKELDLVVERDGLVAFVEVKARRESGFGHPLEAITARKRRDVTAAARGWVAAHGGGFRAFRFDAAVVVRSGGRLVLDYFEDAWRPGGR